MHTPADTAVCYNCDEVGHRANACPNPKKGSGKRRWAGSNVDANPKGGKQARKSARKARSLDTG